MKYTLYPYVAAFLLLTGCGEHPSDSGKEAGEASELIITEDQFKTNGYLLGSMKKMPFAEVVEASGVIDVPPNNKVLITAPVGGFIKRTHLLIGDSVRKGQPLVILENQEFVKMQQEYLEVFNRLDYLKSEYERNETLFEEKIASQKKYLEAKSDYETHMARYQGLKEQLRMLNISPGNVEQGIITSSTTLYAPIAGSVTRLNVATGSYVSPASEIMEIVDKAHLHLELTVFEKDILKVKKGQRIQFTIPEASPDLYSAAVYLVGSALDEVGRTITVHGHLEREDKNFIPGMFVQARIYTDTTQSFSLPEEAVINSDGATYVLKLKTIKQGEYYFERIGINAGKTLDGNTEILSGENLNPDDQYLIKGSFDLIGG